MLCSLVNVFEHTIYGIYAQDVISIMKVRVRYGLGLRLVATLRHLYSIWLPKVSVK